MAKRFQTYFGVAVPPWKEKKLGAGCITIRFVITGTVPSKKNNNQSVVVRRDAVEYFNKLFAKSSTINKKEALQALKKVYSKIRPNERYEKFVLDQLPVLQYQSSYWAERLRDKGLIFPLSSATMNLRFFMKNRHISDTINKQQSIQDLLIEAKIIANDDYKTLNPIHSAATCYFEEINENITLINLSFKL